MQKDIIVKVAEKACFTQKDTKLLLETFVKVLQEECLALNSGENLTITNFLTFKAMTRPSKTIVNPKTKIVCNVEEAKRIKIHVTRNFQNKATGKVPLDENEEGDND